ncbi:MAG: M15 family metallopeptidase [Massilia sp.]|nr:M15 family metallopeptidase [Massilia sp.]
MLIFIALVYFCVACCGIWVVLFSTGRDFFGRLTSAIGQRIALRMMPKMVRVPAPAPVSMPGRRWQQARLKSVRRRALLFGAGAALLAVPTLLALCLSHPAMLPGYAAPAGTPDAQIAALLEGEQLAPPMTLPPRAFTTVEVVTIRPLLVDASRNWGLLDADFSSRLLRAFKIMKEQYGYDMVLLEGYRSPERQTLLASMGSQVTSAGAFQSWHQYGLAADCAFWRDGKVVISEKDAWAMRGYQRYGEVAESLGLNWGGRWAMMDFGHIELRLRSVMRK